MKRSEKEKRTSRRTVAAVAFTAVLLLLAGTVLLRYLRTEGLKPAEGEPASVAPAVQADSAPAADNPLPAPAQEAEKPQNTDGRQDSMQSGTGNGVLPEQAAETPAHETARRNAGGRSGIKYSEQTYQIVTDIIYLMRNQGVEAEDRIRGLVSELKTSDPDLGTLWEGIVDYWFYVSRELEINTGVLPDGLPQDDSLGIVVLGYQLLYDGEMAPELVGRCETALTCAQKYPEAYVVVTGGGTAGGNRAATEAGVMAEWFIGHGIAPQRLIVEEKSLTTDQNATFSCAILSEQYPQIRSLAIVSSDYHVALGSMMYTEAALIYACEHHCEVPYRVISNAAYATSGNPIYSNPMRFSSDIWVMADPRY